jgi:hypothetical protein
LGKYTVNKHIVQPTYILRQSAFCCCDKIPEINNSREEGFILVHTFRGFSPWSAGSMAFRPVARQKHHGRKTWWKEAAHLMGARKQRARQEGARNRCILQSHTPVTYFLHPQPGIFSYETCQWIDPLMGQWVTFQ